MERWIQAHATNTVPGDIVRVKDGSFATELGKLHNGRVCQVLSVYGGDFIVKSIDDCEPVLRRTYYSPNILEKRVEE